MVSLSQIEIDMSIRLLEPSAQMEQELRVACLCKWAVTRRPLKTETASNSGSEPRCDSLRTQIPAQGCRHWTADTGPCRRLSS